MADGNATLFHRYYLKWMELYKKGAVRPITYAKYEQTQRTLRQLAPALTVGR